MAPSHSSISLAELLLPRDTRVRIDKAYREGGIYRIEGLLV